MAVLLYYFVTLQVLSEQGKIADFGLTHDKDLLCDMTHTHSSWLGWQGWSQ